MPNHTNEIQENLKEQEVLTDKRHDKGYKKIFKVKKNFLDFLKKYTDLPWTEELTDKDVELIDKEFVTDQFDTYESDLVYKIRVYNQEFYLFFLQEMQSRNDFTMPFRLLVYMTAIWMDYFKNCSSDERTREDFTFPPIIPLVLYNGKNAWTAKRQFQDMVEYSEEFREYIINFKYILIDVRRLEEEEILSTNTLIDNILWSDKFRDKQELLDKLQKLSERYQKLSKQDQNAWLNWFEHVVGIGKTNKSEQFWEYFEKGDDRMCSALTLIMENERIEGEAIGEARGEARGKAIGEARGKIMIVKQIRKKIEKSLPLEDIADILELETYEIETIYHLLIEHPEWTDMEVATAAVEQEMLVK